MRARVATFGLVVSAIACTRHTPAERAAEPVTDAAAAAAPDASVTAPRAPLGGYPEQVALTFGKEPLGFVSVPLGAREPRPVMIAIHGGSERPERACAAWRVITDAYPFIVCPRGWGGNEAALGWRDAKDTAARIARAVAATKETFGAWVKETDTVVLAGFSMGGSQVARLARREPQTYRRIAVGDSAHDPRPALTFSHAWTAGSGERAVFLCTTSGCEPAMREAARRVASDHAPARLNIAPTQVHALSSLAAQSMRRDWPWLVEGAEGWEAYVAPGDVSLPGRTETFEPR